MYTVVSYVMTGDREHILLGQKQAPNMARASNWFDTMTMYLDRIFAIEQDVATKTLEMLDEITNSNTTGKSINVLATFLQALLLSYHCCAMIYHSLEDSRLYTL